MVEILCNNHQVLVRHSCGKTFGIWLGSKGSWLWLTVLLRGSNKPSIPWNLQNKKRKMWVALQKILQQIPPWSPDSSFLFPFSFFRILPFIAPAIGGLLGKRIEVYCQYDTSQPDGTIKQECYWNHGLVTMISNGKNIRKIWIF